MRLKKKTKKKRPQATKQRVNQGHHLIYPSKEHPEQEVIVKITKGEHAIMSRISWYTKSFVSKGFIKALKHWIVLNQDRAQEIK
jgi:hypothetical protein